MRMVGLILSLLAPLVLSACGPSFGDVSGVVKYKGAPIAGVTVTFFDARHVTPSAVTREDGSYQIKVPVGPAKLSVVPPLAIQIPGAPELKTIALPDKYRDREESGLVCDVKGGTQTHNIDLD